MDQSKLRLTDFKFFHLIAFALVLLYGCSSSKEYEDKSEKNSAEEIYKNINEAYGIQILKIAKEEQQNEMYSKFNDSTYLYWLNNKLIILNNSSKCNIFALNVLYKAGFKCPDENVLTYDLMDTNRFNDILPFVRINKANEIRKGDLIIWNGHVIIFDSLVFINDRMYAQAWWAGTMQENNGDNIINDVVHGKYQMEGNYIVRRPLKRLNK